MGYSKYPNQIDGESELPITTDLVTKVRAEVVNRLRDSVLAVQAELGTVPSSTYGTVTARLYAIQAQLTQVVQDLDAVETELGSNPSGSFSTVAARLVSIASDLTSITSQVSAIETELGTNPKGVYADVAARLAAISSDVAGLILDVNAIETELGTNPSGGYATVVARLDNTDNEVSAINTELGGNPSGLYADVEARLDALDGTVTGLSTYAEVVTPVVSGNQQTGATIDTSVGACKLNPSEMGYPGVSFTLEVIIQTTDSAYDGYFQLYNYTDGYDVVHDLIQTTSIVPEYFSVPLTISDGYYLSSSQDNILDGRIRLASGAGATDRCIVKYAAIRSKPV